MAAVWFGRGRFPSGSAGTRIADFYASAPHSALEVRDGEERYVVEMAPVWNERS
jgi:hypothetical protein